MTPIVPIIYAIHQIDHASGTLIPLIENSGAHCGFASPAIDYLQSTIDLNELLIAHPAATIIASVHGESMIGAFIPDPAHLVVDRAETLYPNDIVVIVVENDFQVRRYKKEKGQPSRFVSENRKLQHLFPPIVEGDGTEVQLWGVVTKIIVDPRTVYGNARIG